MNTALLAISWLVIGFSLGVITCSYIGYRAGMASAEKRRKQIKEMKEMTDEIDAMMKRLGFTPQTQLEETSDQIITDERGQAVSPIQVKKEQ